VAAVVVAEDPDAADAGADADAEADAGADAGADADTSGLGAAEPPPDASALARNWPAVWVPRTKQFSVTMTYSNERWHTCQFWVNRATSRCQYKHQGRQTDL
jgi:hypothetical protein